MIGAAKQAGFNLLRLNGGTSIFETEQFYNLCDENGIFVWQEVPLNWADSAGTTLIPVWREQLRTL
jgi:beta-galactosidase/beta-glucuronidase